MGKIGDLFVRLGLKSDGFKKGMSDAKKETKNFGESIKGMKAGFLAVWAALGTAITTFAKDFTNSTNLLSDQWNVTLSKMKSLYDNFLGNMSSRSKDKSLFEKIFQWASIPGFLLINVRSLADTTSQAKEIAQAAEDMTNAFDAEFELANSIKIQRLKVQQELDELMIRMRDRTLSPADRQAAANRYQDILQPIADAEIKVYGDMMDKAIDHWMAGTGLSRTRDEIIEFFTKIGTEADNMRNKYSDIAQVYETQKGDETNQPIFDIIARYQQAVNQMSDVRKQLSRITNSIKAETLRSLEDIAEWAKDIGKDIDIDLELDLDLEVDDIDISEDLELMNEDITRFLEDWADKQRKIEALNNALENSFISAFSGGLQALTDLMFGLDNAGWEQVLAAFMQPLASTMRQMGEMFIAEGIAMDAFKNSFKNPYALIAAGTALIAVSSAVTSGLNKLVGNPAGGTAASTSAGSTGTGSIDTYEQDITVHVVGEISGDKIILAGQKTLNKWSR